MEEGHWNRRFEAVAGALLVWAARVSELYSEPKQLILALRNYSYIH